MSAASSLPLAGRRVVVTRTREQASVLTERLAGLGAEVLELPVLRISRRSPSRSWPTASWSSARYDWIVFTSGNGVHFFFEEFFRLFEDIRSLGCIRIAGVGDGTAPRTRGPASEGRVPAGGGDGRGAWPTPLIETGSLDNAKVLVITGNLNRDTLVNKLEEARAIVDRLQVYKTEKTDLTRSRAAADFRERGADAILFASSSSAQSFADQAGAALAPGAGARFSGSIGPADERHDEAVRDPGRFRGRNARDSTA